MTFEATRVRRRHTQFTFSTGNLPVKTVILTCIHPSSTSCRIQATARNKASNLRVTSPAACRLTYLQFAGEITRGVIPDCSQLQVILCGLAGIIACDCPGIFSCVCSYFCLRLAGIFTCDSSVLPASCMYFCLQKQAISHASRGQIFTFARKISCKITSFR